MFNQQPAGVTKRKNKLLHFDKCVFPSCLNGKHNGHILFRIPVNPKRQQEWLNIIGNPLLEGYSRNYLSMKAGVCKYHFDPRDFTSAAQNKLQRCVYPLKSNLQGTADCHESALNLCISDYQRNCSTPKTIATTDDELYTNYFAEAIRKLYFPNVVSPVCSVNDNDENMNVASDEEKASRRYSSFKKDLINQFNDRDAEANFEPGPSLNNCALECNPFTAGVFRESETQSSVSPVIEDTSNSKKLRKDILALKEQNIICKQKFTEDAKLKREKLHYFVKLMKDRRNVELERNC